MATALSGHATVDHMAADPRGAMPTRAPTVVAFAKFSIARVGMCPCAATGPHAHARHMLSLRGRDLHGEREHGTQCRRRKRKIRQDRTPLLPRIRAGYVAAASRRFDLMPRNLHFRGFAMWRLG